MKFARRSTSATLAASAAALLGVAACTSTPSPKAVAEDMIESIDGLTESQRECMLDRLDADYTDDELQAIGDANLRVNFDSEDAVQNTSPEFRAFVENLRGCTSESVPTTTTG